MGCSFNLRHQIGELEDARLTVFPEYLDRAVIFFNHFALSLIGNPDYSIAHLQSFGFLRIHLRENAPVTYPREGARLVHRLLNPLGFVGFKMGRLRGARKEHI